MVLHRDLPKEEISKIIEHFWDETNDSLQEPDMYIKNIIPYVKLWINDYTSVVGIELEKYIKKTLEFDKLNERIETKSKVWFGFLNFLRAEVDLKEFDELDIDFLKVISLKEYAVPQTGNNHLILLLNTLVSILMTMTLPDDPKENTIYKIAKKEDFLQLLRVFKRAFVDFFPLFERSCIILSKWISKLNPSKTIQYKLYSIFEFPDLKKNYPELHNALNTIRFVKNSMVSHGSYFVKPMHKDTPFLDLIVVCYNENLERNKRMRIARKIKARPENVIENMILTVQDLIDIYQNLFAFIRILKVFCRYKLGVWEYRKSHAIS